jgi:hypothetical protein
VEVEGGGKLKLKSLPEFPKAREGQTVTLRANQSKQHGLTGLKVNHEEYKGQTYRQLVITNSCKWEFAGGSQNGQSATSANGNSPIAAPSPETDVAGYIDHLMSVADLANQITAVLEIDDPAAIQACFATLCIDTKNRGIVLPKKLPNIVQRSTERNEAPEDPNENAPPPSDDFTDDDIPF